MNESSLRRLLGKIRERGTTLEALADQLSIARSTLHRRLKKGTLTVGDAHQICDALALSNDEALQIFLAQ